ncbi:MAG: hypothetical protein KGY74_10830, partial [Candidatus Cloacimonetes bacterium]|nr:hypothetical protein [Candidatus Cloacimonadota bacterium]
TTSQHYRSHEDIRNHVQTGYKKRALKIFQNPLYSCRRGGKIRPPLPVILSINSLLIQFHLRAPNGAHMQ